MFSSSNFRILTLGSFFLLASIMVFQAATLELSEYIYLFVVAVLILSVSVIAVYGNNSTALIGIISISLAVRLMYFFSTNFALLPFGDTYGQYGLLLSMEQTGRITSTPYDPYFIPLGSINQYSQLPGFQIVALFFNELSAVPIFRVAEALPFLLYFELFIVCYIVIKNILKSLNTSITTAFVVALAVSISSFEIPPFFKYSLPAAILVLSSLIMIWNTSFKKGVLIFTLLSAGLAITHNLSDFIWLLLLFLIVIEVYLSRNLQFFVRLRLLVDVKDQSQFDALKRFFFVSLLVTVAWWTYFAVRTYETGYSFIKDGLSLLFSSYALGLSRTTSNAASLTPFWMLQSLQLRNYLLVSLLVMGVIVLILARALFKSLINNLLLRMVVLVSVLLSLLPAMGGFEFFTSQLLLFAPIIAVILSLPVILLQRYSIHWGKIAGVVVLVVFLFAVSIGFWGNFYAPVYLFDKNTSSASYGEHPLSYLALENYREYLSNSTCTLTNEEYVTSLILPVNLWTNVYGIWSIRPQVGCIAIIYAGYNVTSSYISQAINSFSTPYGGFNFSTYYNFLGNNSDLVFDTHFNNEKIIPRVYYIFSVTSYSNSTLVRAD